MYAEIADNNDRCSICHPWMWEFVEEKRGNRAGAIYLNNNITEAHTQMNSNIEGLTIDRGRHIVEIAATPP